MSRERIIIWWDTQSELEKWHVDVLRKTDDGQFKFVMGSERPDFPVDVEAFGPLEEDLLIQSLKGTFPDSDISLKF
jgi:hypothetical protein